VRVDLPWPVRVAGEVNMCNYQHFICCNIFCKVQGCQCYISNCELFIIRIISIKEVGLEIWHFGDVISCRAQINRNFSVIFPKK